MGVTRLQMQNFLIFLLDLVGVTVGYFAAVWLRFGNIETGYTVMGNDTYYRWLIAIVVLMMIYFLFHPNRGFFKRKFIEEMRMNLQTVILMAAGMAMVAFLIQDAEDYSRFIYIFTSGFGFVWMQIIHRAYRKYWLSRRKDHSYARKMMIITTSDHAEEVIGNIMEEKNWDLWITSVAVVDKDMTGWLINEIPVVAHSYRSIFEYAMRSVVDEVFLYIPMDDEFPIAMTVQNFEDMGIKTNLNISQFQINENLERSLEKVGPYESVSFSGHNVSFVMLMMKRAMDIAGGLVGMLITAIAVIIVGPLVKLESPGPLFFSQKRVGKNGRIFKIYKIRSMYQDAEERKKELMAQNEMDGLMFKMKDDPRITKVGKFIRKTSIDELPQFWNVLKGDMSLVGTRPPTVDEFEQYIMAMEETAKYVQNDKNIDKASFDKYILMHFNIAMVREVFVRQNDSSLRNKITKMSEVIHNPIFYQAILHTKIKECKSLRMLPILLIKIHMKYIAAIIYVTKANLNTKKER